MAFWDKVKRALIGEKKTKRKKVQPKQTGTQAHRSGGGSKPKSSGSKPKSTGTANHRGGTNAKSNQTQNRGTVNNTPRRSQARTGAVGAASKGSVSNAPRTGSVRPAKTGTQRFNGTQSRSGAIGAVSKGSVSRVTAKPEDAKPIKLGTHALHVGETAGNVVKFAAKDTANTTLKLIQQGKSEGKRPNNYKYVRPNAPKGSYLAPNGRYTSETVDDREKDWNKKVRNASNAVEKSTNATLEESVKYLPDEKKYNVPENKILNHFVPSTKSQKADADNAVRGEYRKEYKKGKKKITKSLKDQLDSMANEYGITDDTVLPNGQTYAEYRRSVLKDSVKEYYKEMTAERDKALKKNADVGKLSAKDIGKMGVQTGTMIGETLIPYIGTSGKFLKAADAVLAGSKGGAKALTKAGAKAGAKELSESGRKIVKEYAERIAAGESRTKVMADLTKKIRKSDFANNVKREALANAMQDATIGAAIDATMAKSEGKSGKDFWKYMGESAAMNAALGAPIAGIAGRTSKAGKAALKNEIKAGVNEAIGIKTLSAADRKQMINLMAKEGARTLTKDEYKVLKSLRSKAKSIAINNDEIRADLNKSVELKAETLNKLSKETGVEYKVASADEIVSALKKNKNYAASVEDDFFANGVVVSNDAGKRTIYINKDSDQALGTIAGHETTHLLEGTKQFDSLRDTVREYAEALGEYSDLETRYADLYKEEMSKRSPEEARRYLDEEITAELVGRYMFGDNSEEFVTQLSTKNRNVFQKMYDYVVNSIKKATGDTELRLLNHAKANFEKAYRELGETPNEIRAETKATEQVQNSIDEITKESTNLRGMNAEEQATDAMNAMGDVRLSKAKSQPDTYDNTMYGSVIYDLKGEDLARKQEIGTARFSKSKVDSTGAKLSDGQQKYFADSKARDADGNLLKLYHGTEFAGFTKFNDERGVFLTTSKRDADSYGGNWEGKEFDPNEKTTRTPATGGDYRLDEINPYLEGYRFDTQEDLDAFVKDHPGIERLRDQDTLDDMEYDGEITSKEASDLRKLEKMIESDYGKYEARHSDEATWKDILDDPDRFDKRDIKNALLARDKETYVEDGTTREELLESFRQIVDEERAEASKEEFDSLMGMTFKTRLAPGREGSYVSRPNKRTYALYADAKNPLEYDAKGKPMSAYDVIERVRNSDEYDSAIIRNVRVGRYGDVGDVVWVKNSNQLKSVDNPNPTDSADIRFSKVNRWKQGQKHREALRQAREEGKLRNYEAGVEKEADKLRSQMTNAKVDASLERINKSNEEYAEQRAINELADRNAGTETQLNSEPGSPYNVPDGMKVDGRKARSATSQAKQLLGGDYSSLEKAEIDKSVRKISNCLANNDPADARAEARRVVEKYGRPQEVEVTERPDAVRQLRELKSTLQEYTFNIPEGSGTLKEFKEHHPGINSRVLKVRARKGLGTIGADEVRGEFSSRFPDLFSEDMTTEEMWDSLVEYSSARLDSMNSTRRLSEKEIDAEIDSMVDGILRVAQENADAYTPKKTPIIPNRERANRLKAERESALRKEAGGGADKATNAKVQNYVDQVSESNAKIASDRQNKVRTKSENLRAQKVYDSADKDIRGVKPDVEKPPRDTYARRVVESSRKADEEQAYIESSLGEYAKGDREYTRGVEDTKRVVDAERQDAIDRGIDVDAYKDAKVSYKNPESLTKGEIDKELRNIYFANKNAKTPAHTEIRNERKKALEDELQRRKDEQPAYAALSEDELPENDPGLSILPDEVVRNDGVPSEKISKSALGNVAKEPPRTKNPSWWQSFRRLVVNSFTGFEDLAKAAGNNKMLNQINNVQHWTNKLASWVEGKRSGMDRKVSGDGLNDIFDRAKLFGKKNIERRNDFINYLTYKHAIDRLAYDKPVHLDPSTGGSRYSAKDYQDMMAEIRNKYEQKGELKLLEGFEKGIRGYYDDIMKMRVDSGLVSKDLAEELKTKYPNYIPTLREGDDWLENGSQTGGKQQFAIKDPIKKATGGVQDILDLYQATVRVTKDVIRDAEQNELMRQFAEMMGVDPNKVSKEALGELPSLAAQAQRTETGWKVSFFQDGQMVTMDVDKQIARGLREFNGKEFERTLHFASLFSKPGRWFKSLITDYNIIFGVRNGARDIQQAAVNSKSLKDFTAAIPTAQASVLKKNIPGGKADPWMEAYEANGGLYSTFVQQGKTFAEPKSKAGIKKGADATVGKVLKSLEQVNSAIEITPRLAEFIGTIKKDVGKTTDLAKLKTDIARELYPGKTMQELTTTQFDKVSDEFARRVINLASTETIEKAARNASDITLNFSRNGVWGKALNMGVLPYFNPSIQGMSKTVRMFTENGAEGAKALLNFGMKLGTLTIAPAVANEILCRNNRDYQNLQTREKDSNFFIPIGDGKFIKVPKPRENAVLAEPVTYGLRYFFDKARIGNIEEGEYSQWKDLGQAFKSGWDNIGPVNPFSDNLMSPIVRLAQNKTWYGGSIESVGEVMQKKEGDLKNKDIYDDTTSALAIQLGQTRAAQAVHMSPKKIDDFMDSYFGVIYDIGISQTAETTHGNPIVNQFVKDSVFSNKTGLELWSEFEHANAPKTTKGKVIQKGKDAILGHSALNINEKTQEAKDWLNQKGYDDMTYSTAVTTIRQDDSYTEKQKENIIRQWKRDQIELRRNLVYGSGEVSWKEDPIKTISKTVGVDKAMKDYTYTYVDPDTGEKKNQHLDAWKAFKKTGAYKDDKEKSGQKFVDFYAKMRWTNGKIGESKSYPQWMTASVLAATEKGKNDDLAKAYIRPNGWEDGKSNGKLDPEYQEKIVQRGKNYRDNGGNQIDYRRAQKRIFESSRKLGNEYTSEMFPWDKAMSLATKKGDKFVDLQYYASDTSGKVSRRMNYARCLNEKGYSTKAINKFAKEYDLDVKTSGWNGDQWRAYDAKVEAAVRDKYGSKPLEEQAAIYHIITDDTYHQPFGAVGDYSIKGDTGITELDNRGSGGWGYGWGRRGRRGYHRGGWGYGGSGSGGTMPETASGAIKGKVTDPFAKVGKVGKKSNLDDVYRKKARKLAEANRKKLS